MLRDGRSNFGFVILLRPHDGVEDRSVKATLLCIESFGE